MGYGKFDRPQVRQVTKQWVRENCTNITDRDMGLLELIAERRLITREQIERLYPYFASTNVLNRRLKTLYHQHVIDKFYPRVGLGEGSSKQHVCIDRAGIILLGIDRYNKPLRSEAGFTIPFLGWEHRVMINEYECIVREIVEEEGGEVLIFRVEEPVLFDDHKLIPDILVLVEIGNKGKVFYIEVDLGTEDIPYIKQKMCTYKDYYVSKHWLAQDWAKVFKKPTFPKVLFFTLDGRTKRINTLKDYTSEWSLEYGFHFHSEVKDIIKRLMA